MTPDSRLSELLIRWEDSKENDGCCSRIGATSPQDCPELLAELRRLVAEPDRT